MANTLKINSFTWLNFIKPTREEIKNLKAEFNLHPVIMEELGARSEQSKIENYEDYLFVVYHLPIYNPKSQTSRKAEIDFIVTKNSIATITYEKVEPLHQFELDLKNFESETNSTGEILYRILQEVNNFSLRQLRHIEKK